MCIMVIVITDKIILLVSLISSPSDLICSTFLNVCSTVAAFISLFSVGTLGDCTEFNEYMPMINMVIE